MASYNTNEFRSGLKIILDGDPYNIVENEFVKPGKGQAFNRVRVRNLKTGRVIERTFKSGESVEAADVFETDVQYLYNDGEFWHFMDPGTFEQHECSHEAVGEGAKWIKEEAVCQITLFNGVPLSVMPPNFAELNSPIYMQTVVPNLRNLGLITDRTEDQWRRVGMICDA